MISAVVLPARRDRRGAEVDLFLPLNGKPALQWLLESALVSTLGEIVCVVSDLKPARQKIDLVAEKLFWIANPAVAYGQNATLAAGLWAINPKSEGVMFLAGDQPFTQTELIDALIKKFYQSSAWMVAPRFNGKTLNPLLFRRELFPELLKLTGDRRERSLLTRYEKVAALVQWKEERSFVVLKNHANLKRIREMV
ncbi:MAG TPA: NTP transferase domain-containing protein [Candidatus Binatia bacterium]